MVYQKSLEYVSHVWLRGFKLYSLGDYPYAVKTPDQTSAILVEVFKIQDPAIRSSIHQLELNAGYFLEYITLSEGLVGIYLFSEAGNNPKVKSGDWVEFFGSQHD